jgi:hypothetical protein
MNQPDKSALRILTGPSQSCQGRVWSGKLNNNTMDSQTKNTSASSVRSCQNCKKDFIIESDDFEFYKKIKVPAPTLCPDCRYQRRIAGRNEWNFYKRDCALCGKSMVSIYNPSHPGPVYCQPCWWSDKWNPMDFGRDFDFSKTFFGQFKELQFKVPRVALANNKSVNSEYSNQSNNNKNCYMVVATSDSEDCMYGSWFQSSKNCVDCWSPMDCEIVYESLNVRDGYKCFFVEECVGSNDLYFSRDCRQCNNCFGCVSLRGKSYCWFNEQLTKEEYQKRFADVPWTYKDVQIIRKRAYEFWLKFPRKYYNGSTAVNSTGDNIGHDKNVHYGFNVRRSENTSYSQDALEARDCMDLTETLDNELDYEMEGAGWGANCISMAKSWYNSNSCYSDLNFNCHDIFGCMGLRAKSYCIFNKQYTEEEYKALKEKMISHMKKTGEWGQFFPVETSPFPYNDSLAQDYFPLTKSEVIARGWKWYDRDARSYKVTLLHEKLPAKIGDVNDSIIQEVISCSSQDSESERASHFRCATAFKLHPAELQFYRRFNLPIPHKCFACRLQERLARRNPRKLWHRQCMCDKIHAHHSGKCPNEFETSYSPGGPEIVYCEQCYNSEVA